MWPYVDGFTPSLNCAYIIYYICVNYYIIFIDINTVVYIKCSKTVKQINNQYSSSTNTVVLFLFSVCQTMSLVWTHCACLG